MTRKTRNILLVFAGVALIVTSAVLAMGNLTWTPALPTRAAESALIADPALQPRPMLQDTDGEPSEERLSQIYNTVLPSVVNIQVTQRAVAGPEFGMPEIPGFPGHPDIPQGPQIPRQGQGSGWIWDSEGHIVTNNHVVENAEEIIVFFYNGLWAEAELVAADSQSDLAVLQVTPPAEFELQPLALAQELPPVGHYVLAFGSPFGLSGTMTKGIVSAVGRSFPVGDPTQDGGQYSLPNVVQTDAAINPGNSGGPLVDLNGEVVGVNFAIESTIRANTGVGFAIPMTVIAQVVPALITDGAYAYPFLGIAGQTVNPTIAEEEDLPESTLGIFVATVTAGGPAAAAGVQEGDVVTAIDDVEVRTFEDLINYLVTETAPGQRVTLQLLRDGEVETVEVTLGERPREEAEVAPAEAVTIGEAIDIARDAVLEADLLPQIASVTADRGDYEGRNAWIVTLTGAGQQASVVIDPATGEILNMTVENMEEGGQ